MFSKYFDSNNLPSVPSQFSKWCTSIFFFIQEFILDTYSVMYKMNLFFFTFTVFTKVQQVNSLYSKLLQVHVTENNTT